MGVSASIGGVDTGTPAADTVFRAFWAAAARCAAAEVGAGLRIEQVVPPRAVGYRQLAHAALSCAWRLKEHGVQAGDIVALLCGRSIDAIAAMLGINALGAVYAPLDPAAPDAMLRAIVRDCSIAAAVVDHAQAPRALGWGLSALSVEELARNEASELRPPQQASNGESPAYILHTSGTTGTPKGVVVPNRAILRLVHGQDYAPFDAGSVFLHAAPLAFDASVFEIWGALLHGAGLVVAPERVSLQDLAQVLTERRVSVAWLTAGLFHLMVDHHAEALAGLHTLIAGGDVLSPLHLARLSARAPGLRLVNGYGPTENTTFTCCHVIDKPGEAPVPIGRPIQGGEVFILDERLQPLPSGEAGQIAAAGMGLAIGYLNQPELTREKFPIAPPACAPYDRLYLTGDRGRRRPDGVVEFLGRLDRQVKIDGKRVELDGVEGALLAIPGVRQAAVLFEGGCIAAFVSGEALAVDPLRAALAGRLPPEAMPGQIAIREALPLNANGKVDRRRLSAEAPMAAARTPGGDADLERVRAAWEKALGHDRFSDDDNFFDVGGGSLKMLRLHAELCAFAEDLRIVELFEGPSVTAMARRLRRGATGEAATGRARGQRQALFLQARKRHEL